ISDLRALVSALCAAPTDLHGLCVCAPPASLALPSFPTRRSSDLSNLARISTPEVLEPSSCQKVGPEPPVWVYHCTTYPCLTNWFHRGEVLPEVAYLRTWPSSVAIMSSLSIQKCFLV